MYIFPIGLPLYVSDDFPYGCGGKGPWHERIGQSSLLGWPLLPLGLSDLVPHMRWCLTPTPC